MFLTGYHGTSLAKANNIINEKKFNVSCSDTEWLGEGIYFYFDVSDAYNWRGTEAILHSVIKIDESEYLDIDSAVGAMIYKQITDAIFEIHGKYVDDSRDIQRNQCAAMKILWDAYPKLKAVSASFPTEETKFRTLLDKRTLRKEFCVRNNECIKCTQLIRKGDLDD